MNVHSDSGPERMSPAIRIADPGTDWWVGQAMLRLRREVAWQRHIGHAALDPAQAALDLVRHNHGRQGFFAADPACRYLGERIDAPPPRGTSAFSRLAEATGLTDAECFVLGLALAARIDGALGPVLATCQNDDARPWPTLALAQSLWDDPLAVLAAQDPARPLSTFGLLAQSMTGSFASTDPLLPCPGLARFLTGCTDPADFGLGSIAPTDTADTADPAHTSLAARLAGVPQALEIVPLIGPAQGDRTGLIGDLSGLGARLCLTAPALPVPALRQTLLLGWLMARDLLLDVPLAEREEVTALAPVLAQAARLRLRVFLHLTNRDLVAALPQGQIGPVVSMPVTTTGRRAELLRSGLGRKARACMAGINEVARDFRMEPGEIARVTASLHIQRGALRTDRLIAACRTECSIDFHGLAEPLEPRFGLPDIVLPPAIACQFGEAIAAIRGAGRVLHDWGGAAGFGEGGIALLFAGVPGTGKTMGAHVLARELDLPLYRVDLSQIVNKYIGETEKNLKRVFDAAEKLRCILFFDEADVLFGKRTDVKNSNDRFANGETGYLLQRMESFTGVAVLATNRRKDLDEAFSRRLRYVIEFPVPGAVERERIWAGVFPPGADLSTLDLGFLARQFQLSGGHIRSIAFNASLQAAAQGEDPRVTMRDVLIATKRELDKLSRTSGAEAFGPWFNEIEELRA